MNAWITRINNGFVWIAGVFLVAMTALTTANILLRLVWVPIQGTYELMGFFGALATAFALGYTQLQRGHIAVDILINTFPRRVKRVLEIVNSGVLIFFFSAVSWYLSDKAWTLRTTGEVTETLRIIYYPFTYGVALGFAFLAVVFLRDFIRAFRKQTEEAG